MKAYNKLNLAQRLLLSLIEKIEKLIYKRKWSYREQIWWARRNIVDDSVWMSHDKIAREVSERHSAMLKDHWHTTVHLSQARFRESVGLCPHNRFYTK